MLNKRNFLCCSTYSKKVKINGIASNRAMSELQASYFHLFPSTNKIRQINVSQAKNYVYGLRFFSVCHPTEWETIRQYSICKNLLLLLRYITAHIVTEFKLCDKKNKLMLALSNALSLYFLFICFFSFLWLCSSIFCFVVVVVIIISGSSSFTVSKQPEKSIENTWKRYDLTQNCFYPCRLFDELQMVVSKNLQFKHIC